MIPEISMQEMMARTESHERSWEYELRDVIREHGAREGEALAAYQTLIEQVTDPGIRFLANLILEDEARHHRMIGDMMRRIESDLTEVEMRPNVPRSIIPDAGLYDATDTLLELEKDDQRELRRLGRLMRNEPNGSLLPLLVELLQHDTAKHIAILRFIQDHA